MKEHSINIELAPILFAREQRTKLKLENAAKGLHSITLSLNIPGIPKSDKLLHAFFLNVIDELKIHFKASTLELSFENKIIINDDAGDFYLLGFSSRQIEPKQLKDLTENFEDTHPLGRIIDVDVFHAAKGHISSGKEKSCFFCNQHSALYCMRNNMHNYKEMREKIRQEITAYLNKKREETFIKKISALALNAILFEVSASPKPGLVYYQSSGIHQDMNYYSFLTSSSVISAYFNDFCKAGINYTGKLEEALPHIRKYGIIAEQSMFKATGGVNTQKGLIFIFGLSLFTYSYLFAHNLPFTEENFRKTVMNITKNIVSKELKNKNRKENTHGEKVFKFYNVGGVRQEAEKGFITAFNTAIPYLKNNSNIFQTNNQEQINHTLLNALLKIMSENNDSNILYRSNPTILKQLKHYAYLATKDISNFSDLYNFCKKHNISPGGSADLLAFSIFIYLVNMELKTEKNEL